MGSSREFSSFVELLLARAADRPDDRALTFLVDGETQQIDQTYRQLDEQARAIAAWLQAADAAGQRALLCFPPGLDFISAFFGCLYAGAVAVPTYPPRPKRSMDHVESIVADAEPTVALTTASMSAEIEPRLPDHPTLAALRWQAVDAIDPQVAGDWRRPQVGPETLSFLQYTSGSTGTPKGVMVSHGNLLYIEQRIKQCFEHLQSNSGLGWLPFYHDMGLIGNVLQAVYMARPCVLMSPMAFLQKPLRWLEAISRHRASTSGGPNFAYDLCVQRITPKQREGLDLSCWEVAFTGAEAVRASTLKRFAETFAPCGFRPEAFYPCYGMAEATLIVSGGRKADPPVVKAVDVKALAANRVEFRDAASDDAQDLVGCGRTLPEEEILIVDPETCCRLADDQVGEIWVRGPGITQGYWRRPEESSEVFGGRLADTDEGPFLRSGDLGFLHDGELFVTGRRKDVIIIRGRNYYPQDISRTVRKSHQALEAGGAAFSVDLEGAERLVVAQEVQRQHLRRLDADEVTAAIREAVADRHDLQVDVVLLLKPGGVPRTSSGKVQNHAARAKFLDGGLPLVAEWRAKLTEEPLPEKEPPTPAQMAPADAPRDTSASETAESLKAWLVARIARRVGVEPAEIDVRKPLVSYGLDSVAAVGIAGALEERLERPLSPALVYDYPTIDLLARHLAGELEEPEEANQGQAGTSTENEPIAIIGIGCRFPGAAGPEAFWRLLHDGVDAIREVPPERFNVDDYFDPTPGTPGKMNTRYGGFLDNVDKFDPQLFGIAPREAETMDPQQRLLLEVSWEALEHAGVAPQSLAGGETGVFVGISSSDYGRLFADHPHGMTAHASTGNALCIAANRLSFVFDLAGPSWAVDTACSSSLVAVHQACTSLRRSECDMALAAGVNLVLSPQLSVVFSHAGMLAPDGRCKPFDEAADGYGRGEGCGVVVLKRLSDAKRDGDTVLAVIRGSAVNQDGRSNGLTAPSGRAHQRVVRRALRDAGVRPSDIQFVEAHGTGTSLGDPIEVNALRDALLTDRAATELCWLGSVKANIGHTEAASGIAGLIKTVLALRHQEIPPQLHLKKLNPMIQLDGTPLSIPTQPQPWPRSDRPRRAGVHAYGFGGTNAHVILEEAPEPAPATAEIERPRHLLTLSARTDEALGELVGRYAAFLANHPELPPGDVAYSANTGREQFGHRLAVAAGSTTELQQQLAAIAGEGSPAVRGRVSGDKRPKVAFLFSGQGAQYVDMGRQLYQTQPSFRRTLEHCDEILRPLLERSLLEVLYADDASDSPLPESACTRPALFALEYALAELWRTWGVEPAAVMGQGVGEFVAACVAGVFTLEEGLTLIVGRESEQPGREVDFQPPSIPLVSSVLGKVVREEVTTPDYWRQHEPEPVGFCDGMASLIDAGCDTFLEVGPQPALLAMGRRCVPAAGRLWLATLCQDRPDWQQVLESLARLYVAGAAIDWKAFDGDYPRRKVALPTYPFKRQRCWIESASAPFINTRGHSELIEQLKAASADERPAMVISHLRSELARTLGLASADEIDVEQRLFDLGVDSLMAVELQTRLESSTGVSLPATAIFAHPTVGELGRHLHAQISPELTNDST